MTAPRRLLVFGGSGFLGVHVVRAALAAGFEVAVAARAPPSVGVDAGAVTFTSCDALVDGAVERVFDTIEPDTVVVCTALATIAECERYPTLARTLNVDLPARAAHQASTAAARFVLVSTDLVFGGRAPLGERFTELDEPAPLSNYGRTKQAGETAVHGACSDALVVRLPLLFGNSFGRALGASDALVAAVRRGERPQVFKDEWRTPLDVACAGRALITLARTNASGMRHVAGRERLSRVEIGERALVAAGFSLDAARSSIQPTTRAEAGHAARPADVSLASIHELDATLT